ncbi:glycosyl hydrolase [Spirillospora sp. NPDC048911]|uniref:glycosyl hydrolase n=1 Tax=Spirillospora sp. NPDC048911 TaxID=3364527 RepID=UPI003713BCD1
MISPRSDGPRRDGRGRSPERAPARSSRGTFPRLSKPALAVVAGTSCGVAAVLVALNVGDGSGQAARVAQRPDPRQASQSPIAAGPAATAEQDRDRGTATLPGSGRAATRPKKRCTVDKVLAPTCGAWWGAAVNTYPQPAALRAFERKIDRPVAVYHKYYRGKQVFPSRTDIALAREPGRRRLLLLNWKPDAGESWAKVASGSMDGHIDTLSAHIKRNFPERFWLAIHHEPEEEVRERPGSGYTAADYRAMFRHVVKRFRENGVDNAVFTMVYMGYSGYVVKPWFKATYPGNDVVDWIGFDAYADPSVKTFTHLVDRAAPAERRLGIAGFYRWARANLSSRKPLMLSEWGGTELSGDPRDKAELFRSIAREIKSYPALKALIYWDAKNGHKFGDTRVDASGQALQAYRALGRLPYFNPAVPKR